MAETSCHPSALECRASWLARAWASLSSARLATLLIRPAINPLIVVTALLKLLSSALHLPFWRCPLYEVLHLPCPGCGLTRGTEALLHGDLAAMIRLHPFAPLLLIVLVMSAATALLPARMRRRFAGWVGEWESRLGLTPWLLLAFVVFGVGRFAVVACQQIGNCGG